jgi:hypothetical protein
MSPMTRPMLGAALLLVLPALLAAEEPPPQILGVYIERLKPGVEAAYGKNEEDIARTCVRLKCPHPYLGLESVTGPKEVWWFNAYSSEADKDSVARAWEQNSAATAALRGLSQRKRPLTGEPKSFFATYRGDPGSASCWRVGGARFFVIASSKEKRGAGGCVFDAPDGTRLAIMPVATRREADLEAAAAGDDARVFAVRPSWSLPAQAWVKADPDFWRARR